MAIGIKFGKMTRPGSDRFSKLFPNKTGLVMTKQMFTKSFIGVFIKIGKITIHGPHITLFYPPNFPKFDLIEACVHV